MAAGKAIVEVEVPNHRAVDERRCFSRQRVTEAERATGVFARRLSGREPSADLCRLAIMSADSTAERIDQPLDRGVHGFGAQVLEFCRCGVLGYFLGDAVHGRLSLRE